MAEIEGVIKFDCTWDRSDSVNEGHIAVLNQLRSQLFLEQLIGVDKQGYGFGNVSACCDSLPGFFITGSQTGAQAVLTARDYVHVYDYDFEKNWLACRGLCRASSESLTHAAVYTALPEVRYVAHVHHAALWQKLLETLPHTDKEVPYGTPAMAVEVGRLLKLSNVQATGIFAMAGHVDGVVAFGTSGEKVLKNISTYTCVF